MVGFRRELGHGQIKKAPRAALCSPLKEWVANKRLTEGTLMGVTAEIDMSWLDASNDAIVEGDARV